MTTIATISHERLSPDVIQPLLRGRFGTPYDWSEECRSTQDVLRDAALPEGAVAVTEHQTGGRGREGRTWEDARGRAVLVSLLLRPPPRLPSEQLSLVAGLAVAEAVDAVAGTRCGLKWPNDVLVDDRKLAGILLEATTERVVCGIGVNVNQSEAELPPTGRLAPTSLLAATGRPGDRASVLVELLSRLEGRYDAWRAHGLRPLLAALEARDVLRGRHVTVGGVTGTAAGIAADGRLRIVEENGRETLVASGEVVSLPAPGRAGSRSDP